MDNINLQYSPYGFARPSDGQFHQANDPDPEVLQLWNKYNDRTFNVTAIKYRLAVIEAALRLFGGDFGAWLDIQTKNDQLGYHGRELLKDTLTFINTGYRPVMVPTRAELMRMEVLSDVKLQSQKTSLRELLACDPKEAITKWVTRRAGVYDMLCTLYVCFGASSQPNNP